MRRSVSQRLLILGGLANLGIALFHLVIVIIGAPGYRYFGVPKLAELQEQGSVVPAVLTLSLTILFALFATYAFAGAGVLRRLPFLRTILVFISAIYVLRGLAVVRHIIFLAAGEPEYLMAVGFSGAALAIGIAYVAGTVPLFKKQVEKSEP